MDDYLKDVVIIGAGLGGCALALALTDQHIPVRIYESRPEVSNVIPSGVILTPNGLRILDHLGVFNRIKDRCYISTHRIFKNDQDETTKSVPVGSAQEFGYLNHRIWRALLFDEMRLMLSERSVPILYASKFNGIVEETASSVTFLINEETLSASLLLGADGINSSVRAHIAPEIRPSYTGLVGALAHIRRDAITWPYENYDLNATIQSAPGAIFWMAEDPVGTDLMIGKQTAVPEEGLAELQRDREKRVEFYRRDYERYGATAKKIIDAVSAVPETLYVWPYMAMPTLDRWFSSTGRVVILGDSAHALPPSSGQGINQALEDVSSLTKVLVGGRGRLVEGLGVWQRLRQERIDAVMEWTVHGSNVARLPEGERKALVEAGKLKEGQWDDMGWLYIPKVEKELQLWIDGAM